MAPHNLPQCLYRGVRQNFRRQGQGTFQSPFPYTPPQYHHRRPHGPQPIQYYAQGSQQPFQDHQGGYVHLCTGPLKQKRWKVPASAHIGPPPPGISNPSVQANQPTNSTAT